jgi:hypothetical protein
MELEDEFEVPLGVPETWSLLTDVGRIAPCLPGARLDEVVDGEYRGVVRVKVGPITVEYKGVASFAELDEVGRRVVLRAQGRETRGQGNASATVTATLVPVGAATRVAVSTELDISGRVAQFGRGALADVSSKLLGQFVKNLERDLMSGSEPVRNDAERSDLTMAVPVVTAESGAAHATSNGDQPPSASPPAGSAASAEPSPPGSEPRAADPPERTRFQPERIGDPEPIDLGRLGAGALARRVLPIARRAAPFVVLLVVAALLGRARRRRS